MAEEGDCFTSPGRCQSPMSDRKRLGLGGEAAGAGSPLCPGHGPRGARRGPRGWRSPLPGVLSRHARLSPRAPRPLGASRWAQLRPRGRPAGPRAHPSAHGLVCPRHRRLARPGPAPPAATSSARSGSDPIYGSPRGQWPVSSQTRLARPSRPPRGGLHRLAGISVVSRQRRRVPTDLLFSRRGGSSSHTTGSMGTERCRR